MFSRYIYIIFYVNSTHKWEVVHKLYEFFVLESCGTKEIPLDKGAATFPAPYRLRYEVGTVASLSCVDGYIHSGATSATCTAGGQWSFNGPEATCTGGEMNNLFYFIIIFPLV